MNYFSTAIYFAIIVSILTGCKKDNDKTGFNYIQAAGVWVPYENIDEFGFCPCLLS
jgi:hypothetical protein